MLSSFRKLSFLAILAVAGFGLTGCGPTESDAPVVEPESAEMEDMMKQYADGVEPGKDGGGDAAPDAAPDAGGGDE